MRPRRRWWGRMWSAMNSNVHITLPDIGHGDHCCLLFSSPEEQAKATVPYLILGLERNERSVFVGAEASIDRIRRGLTERGVSVDAETRSGRLMLSSGREYLDGGRFSTEKMLSFLQQAYDSALAAGYGGLRASGDVSWQIGPDQDYKDILYYEALLDVFFLGKRMVGLCGYPKDLCPPGVLAGILNAHRIAAIDMDYCANFHYVQPDILLEKDPAVLQGKRVEWMTSQLLRARRAEEEVLRLNAELERRVADRTAKLEAANKELEAFSYSVSHDLKAPLRAIKGFSEMLLEAKSKAKDDDGVELLEKVVDGARRMGTLIDDLLKLSRLGRSAVKPQWVDLGELARDVVREQLDGRGEREIAVVLQPLPKAWGDPSLLRQVLTNLIGNAVKYTAPRPLATIEIGGAETPEAVEVYVKDNGVGFDPRNARKIFEAFQRLHGREFDGSGIGLTIVERVIGGHGGQVWAESQEGQGSTFRFRLPKPAKA